MRYNHFDMLPERAFLKVGGRITLEGGGGGSPPPPSPQQVTTTTSNIPDWLQGPTKAMVARGELLSQDPYRAYTGERVAGFAPAQQQAFKQIYGLQRPEQYGQAGQSIAGAQNFGAAGAMGAMGFRPTDFQEYQMRGPADVKSLGVKATDYNAARAAAAQVGDTTFDRANARQYMSPYQQEVTNIAKREATSDAQAIAREQAANAARAGAFGGSRFGIEQALLGSKLATNLGDIETKGRQAAFENAQQQFERDRAAQFQNAQLRQQSALANQAAINQARQFGAQQGMTAQQLNQQAALQAALANQQTRYNVGAQNLSALLNVQQQQEAARQAAAGLNLQGAQFGAQTGLQAGTQLANLGTAQQTSDLNRIQALAAAGEQQQSMEQARLNNLYQQYMEQRDWEKNQLGFLSGLIRGTPFSTSTTQGTSVAGPTSTSQLLSAGLGLAGLASLLKKEGGKIDKTEGMSKRDKKAMMGDGLAKAGLYKAMGGN